MRKVLIVDDEPLVVRLLSLTMPSTYETIQARNGSEAIALAEQCSPDVVLLDYDMPGMNGLEVLRRMKKCETGKKARVIMVSGNMDDAHRDLAMSLGADGYFAKPFSPLALLQRVTDLLENAPGSFAQRVGGSSGAEATDQVRAASRMAIGPMTYFSQATGEENQDMAMTASHPASSQTAA